MVLNLKKWKKNYDLSGRKFGKLTVRKFLYFKFTNKADGNVSFFLCDCKCGGTKILNRRILLSGKTNSCGCIKAIKYKTDESYFEKINTQDKAYFYGFMLTDGWVNERILTSGIKISVRDIDLLKSFKKYLKTDRPIKIIKDKSYTYGTKKIKKNKSAFIQIGIRKIVKDLINLGVRQNKSYNVKFPNTNIVPHKLMPHFIRGIYDGDGTIGKSGLASFTSGSKNFLKGLKNYLNKYKITNTKIIKYDTEVNYTKTPIIYYRLQINSLIDINKRHFRHSKTGGFLKIKNKNKSENSKRFFKLIYNNCSKDLFLKRKKQKVKQYLG